MSKADVVLINPGNRRQIYQDLGQEYSAIEPPFWIAVIAAKLREGGIEVAIIDANAEGFSPQETAEKVNALDPLLAAVIVYGSQPSASTQNMTIAGLICRFLKERTSAKVALGGLHPSALPEETLKEEKVDFVIQGEGPYTLLGLIEALKSRKNNFTHIPGLWYYDGGAIKNNTPVPLIKNLDEVLPIAAWDLLPMEKYRAHNWHCFDHLQERSPYAAIYTSLGCPFSCVFCCINALFGNPGIRYRSPKLVVDEISSLVDKYRVRNLKIVDELFILEEKNYMEIVRLLIQREYDLNIWAYARVDTVKPKNLTEMKKAGINWLALGIESANPTVRDMARKMMYVKDIKKVVKAIQDAGIRVIGNFIFGLPDDTQETMRETLNLALELKCDFVNFYCGMAYPGSKLYEIALENHWALPEEWHGFSQHSYETQPLPTRHLSAKDVLEFRDNAFHQYFTNPGYLEMIEGKFGIEVKKHIEVMAKARLKRKLLEIKENAEKK